MTIKSYSDLNSLELDTLREIGSIGTGNAATALSSLIGQQVRIEMPEVRIMGYNEAIEWIGGPEEITAGVLVKMSGQVNGIMLSVQQLKFVNLVLESMLGKGVEDYSGLHEMECSALIEVGNIMISTFINALSSLAGIDIERTVFLDDQWASAQVLRRHRTPGQPSDLPAVWCHAASEGAEQAAPGLPYLQHPDQHHPQAPPAWQDLRRDATGRPKAGGGVPGQ